MSRANQLASTLAEKTINAISRGFRDIIAQEFPVAPQDYSHIWAIQQKQADQIAAIQNHLRTITQTFLPRHPLSLPALSKKEPAKEQGNKCLELGIEDDKHGIEIGTASKQLLVNVIRQLITANKSKTESLSRLMGMIKEQEGYSLQGKQFARQFQEAEHALICLLKAKRLPDIPTQHYHRQGNYFVQDGQIISSDSEKESFLPKHLSSQSSEKVEQIVSRDESEDNYGSKQLSYTHFPQMIEGFNESFPGKLAKSKRQISKNEQVLQRTEIASIRKEIGSIREDFRERILQIEAEVQTQMENQAEVQIQNQAQRQNEVEMRAQMEMQTEVEIEQTVSKWQFDNMITAMIQMDAKVSQKQSQFQIQVAQMQEEAKTELLLKQTIYSQRLQELIEAIGRMEQEQRRSSLIISNQKSKIEELQSEGRNLSLLAEQMRRQLADERKRNEIEQQHWQLQEMRQQQQMRDHKSLMQEVEERKKEANSLKSRLVEEVDERKKVERELLEATERMQSEKSIALNKLQDEIACLQQSFGIEKRRVEADLKRHYQGIYHGIDDALKSKIDKYEEQLLLLQFNGQVLEGCGNEIRYLVKAVEDRNKSRIKSTRLLFRFDPKNKANFHQYIANHPHIVIVLRTASNVRLASYCHEKICENPKMGDAMLMSLSTFKTYPLIVGRQAFEYDPYHIIIGRSELRIRVNDRKVYSNFGMSNACFMTEGDSIAQFLQKSKLREDDLISYEIFTVMFEE